MVPNDILAIAKSVVGPARSKNERERLEKIISAHGAKDIAAFLRHEKKICEAAKKKLPTEQHKRLILAFDFIKWRGMFDEAGFRSFRLHRRGLRSNSTPRSDQQNTSSTTSPQKEDDAAFFLGPQLFKPSEVDKTDDDFAIDEDDVEDGVPELMELKGFKVGSCYRYQINEKTCTVAIRSFTSDENHANCVLVMPFSETFLGQSHECNGNDGNLTEIPGLVSIYESEFVQVKKKVKPVPLDPSFLKECMEPQLIPRVVYEPMQAGKRLNFAYYLDNDGSNIVGRRSGSIGYIDMCCGAGGAHQGYKDHGIVTLKAVDLDPLAIETFKQNNPESAAAAVVDNIDNLLKDTTVGQLQPLQLHQSSPCQGFSMKNHNIVESDEDKKNNELSYLFVEALGKWQPAIGVFENVPGMWRAKCFRYLLRILKDLVGMKYQFRMMILRDCDFGGPQKRPRLFIVAVKSYIPLPPRPHVSHVHPKLVKAGQNKPWVTCDNVLELFDLCPEGTFPNQQDRRISNTTPGEHETFQLQVGGLAPGVRATGAPVFHYRPYQDSGKPRVISVRETAALQGFPNDYEFQGSLTEKYKQAGNAVSCRVMRALVGSLKPSLEVLYREDYQQDDKFLGNRKPQKENPKRASRDKTSSPKGNQDCASQNPQTNAVRTKKRRRDASQAGVEAERPTKRRRTESYLDQDSLEDSTEG